jgi:ring-1,2-phenylacetyl-CoA epoxidase subunit PaaD
VPTRWAGGEVVRAVLERARSVAETVTDPELPMQTLADLGVLRAVDQEPDGRVVVSITPTYSGCPAMATMRDDLVHRLQQEGFEDVTVKVSLSPAWTSDWITQRGRKALAEHGISPPGPAHRGPVSLSLLPTRRVVRCPRCGTSDVALVSEFGSTACKAMYQCRSCREPFDHVKEI